MMVTDPWAGTTALREAFATSDVFPLQVGDPMNTVALGNRQ
jgi:hypothetical protein